MSDLIVRENKEYVSVHYHGEVAVIKLDGTYSVPSSWSIEAYVDSQPCEFNRNYDLESYHCSHTGTYLSDEFNAYVRVGFDLHEEKDRVAIFVHYHSLNKEQNKIN